MSGATIQMRVDVGGSDGIPHTFLVVTHPDGRQVEYGLVPSEHLSTSGPGTIDITGTGAGMAPHEWDFGTDVVPLSDAQYQKLMEDINRSIANPPDYILPGTWWPNDGTNCTGWATDVWNDNGLPNEFGETNRWVWNPYGQLLWHELKKWLNDSYLAARTPPRYDPLAIDLDGDGIETVGVAAGVLFDHNADGIKTGTGWLKGDDAFLVLDRDGNGLIDSGRELFGVDTIVPADPYGGVGYAADGFVALSSIDGNGDKVFDANDAQFANVRLWRDLNQDGISQANELQTLASAGITAINLGTHQATKTLPGGNTQTLAADVAGIDGSAVSLNLASNPFYRQFPDHLDTTAVADLPDMRGSGSVRDLREATTQSATLQADLRTLATQGHVNRIACRAIKIGRGGRPANGEWRWAA